MKVTEEQGTIARLLDEVYHERLAQHDQWGQQNHPWVSDYMSPRDRAMHHGVPTEKEARDHCQHEAGLGSVTFADILIEEVAEAVAADTEAEARRELVQVAAVAVAAIEAIDRGEGQ